jgi:hypothetical protein
MRQSLRDGSIRNNGRNGSTGINTVYFCSIQIPLSCFDLFSFQFYLSFVYQSITDDDVKKYFRSYFAGCPRILPS